MPRHAPFIETTVGEVDTKRRYVNIDCIAYLIEMKQASKCGIVVRGEPEPIWCNDSYQEIVARIHHAYRGGNS